MVVIVLGLVIGVNRLFVWVVQNSLPVYCFCGILQPFTCALGNNIANGDNLFAFTDLRGIGRSPLSRNEQVVGGVLLS